MQLARKRSVTILLIIQSINAFNDNALKIIFISLAPFVFHNTWQENYKYIITSLLIIPFIILSPLCGYLADRFRKRNLIFFCLILQSLALFISLIGTFQHSPKIYTFGFAILAVQSTFFSPAKLGILKEYVGSRRLTMINGLVEIFLISSILIGGVVGAKLFMHYNELLNSYWDSAFTCVLILFGSSLILPFLIFIMRKTPSANPRFRFNFSILFSHFFQIKHVLHVKKLSVAVLNASYFWAMGGVISLILVDKGYKYGNDAPNVTAKYLLLVGVGIAFGSLVTSLLCYKKNNVNICKFGGFALAVSLFISSFFILNETIFEISLTLIGISGGCYFVPLASYIQDKCDSKERGRTLATTNLITNLASIIAIIFHFVLSNRWNVEEDVFLGIFGGFSLLFAFSALLVKK